MFFKDSMQPSLVLVDAIHLAAWRSVEGKTLNKLLSVPVGDQTPNSVCAQGAKGFSGAAPSILRFQFRKPARATGRSHQGQGGDRGYGSLRIAPWGGRPVSR